MIAAPNLWLLAGTVVMLPLLVPRGPGQSTPVDAITLAYILVALVGLGRSGRALRLPARGPLLLILGASLTATVVGLSLPDSMLSLLVEAYLFLLFLCVANDLCADPRGLRVVLTVWSVAALLWATVFVGFHFQLLPEWLQELLVANSKGGGYRVAGAARNPNLAAGYMMISFFVLLGSPWPRRALARLAAAGWLLLGLYLTGSNGALLGLAAGMAVLAVAAGVRSSRTPGQRLGVVGAALVVGGLVLGSVVMAGIPRVGVVDVQALAQRERGGMFGGSLGRLDRSVAGRLAIWSNAWNAAGSDVVVGVGPGAARRIPLAEGTLQRGLHNDYLAFLLERGVLGLLGLLALTATLLRWSARLLGGHLPDGRGGWWVPAGLGGAVVASLLLSTNHESFHFRHVWVLFALVWAASQLMAARPAPADGIEADPVPKEPTNAGR
jgi:O-antigen ligase